jgi:hypothetical protein
VNPETVTHEVLAMEIRNIAGRLDKHVEEFREVRDVVFGGHEGAGINERLRNIERDLGRISKLALPLVIAASVGSGSLIWKQLFP